MTGTALRRRVAASTLILLGIMPAASPPRAAVFGQSDESVGDVSLQVQGRVVFARFQAPAAGVVESLYVYIDPSGSDHELKLALYDWGDQNNGSADTLVFIDSVPALIAGAAGTFSWVGGAFTAAAAIAANRWYGLALWAQEIPASSINLRVNSSGPGRDATDSLVIDAEIYSGDWPSTHTDRSVGTFNWEGLLYCVYIVPSQAEGLRRRRLVIGGRH